MDSFKRMLKYVWPQWPRLITVMISAFVCAALFALSFMTVVPLLKVMMGEEGLHGWVDRKSSDYRYGMDFYLPDKSDFTASETSNIAYYLLITDVAEDGIAERAGLKLQDRIIGAGQRLVGPENKYVTSTQILEQLATTVGQETVTVQVAPQHDELRAGTDHAGARHLHVAFEFGDPSLLAGVKVVEVDGGVLPPDDVNNRIATSNKCRVFLPALMFPAKDGLLSEKK